MESKPEQELMAIVEDVAGYDEKARLAACWELEKRGVATDHALVAESKILKNQQRKEQEASSVYVFTKKQEAVTARDHQLQESDVSFIPYPLADTLVLASGGKRFANLLIDYVAYLLFVFFVMGNIRVILGLLGIDIYDFINPVMENLLVFFWYVVYHTLFEFFLNGRTIGKMITRTRVLNEEGQKPGFGKVLGRSLARLIPFDAFSYLGEEARGWHDRVSGTIVIDEKKSVLRADWV